jgi:hypothetical protein
MSTKTVAEISQQNYSTFRECFSAALLQRVSSLDSGPGRTSGDSKAKSKSKLAREEKKLGRRGVGKASLGGKNAASAPATSETGSEVGRGGEGILDASAEAGNGNQNEKQDGKAGLVLKEGREKDAEELGEFIDVCLVYLYFYLYPLLCVFTFYCIPHKTPNIQNPIMNPPYPSTALLFVISNKLQAKRKKNSQKP